MSPFDRTAVERAAAGLELVLPRARLRGRLGEARASSVGAALEIHDFRSYHPGDDLRHIDWNAVARTGELVVRVRQAEVAPRVEVVVDASRSMAITAAKAVRAKEIVWLVAHAALAQRLELRVLVAGARPQAARGVEAAAVVERLVFDGRLGLAETLPRCGPLGEVGVRVVVSDFLFEADLPLLAAHLQRGAAAVTHVQLLDRDETEPPEGESARLVDVEDETGVDRLLLPSVVKAFRDRLEQHLRLVEDASRRAGAALIRADVATPLADLARRTLSPLLRPRGAR